jgi:hypothetical protein
MDSEKRGMTGMMVRLTALFSVVALAMPLGAQPPGHASYSIGAGQVAHALSAQGIEVAASQVKMVAEVVASRPEPDLVVLGTGAQADTYAGGGRLSWVRLGCRNPGICLPFFVRVPAALHANAGHPGQRSAQAPPDEEPQKKAMEMRAGTRATLVLTGRLGRIELAVISLESGAMGHTIRVATPDYKQFYRARIAGTYLLKGSF